EHRRVGIGAVRTAPTALLEDDAAPVQSESGNLLPPRERVATGPVCEDEPGPFAVDLVVERHTIGFQSRHVTSLLRLVVGRQSRVASRQSPVPDGHYDLTKPLRRLVWTRRPRRSTADRRPATGDRGEAARRATRSGARAGRQSCRST